MVSWYYIVAFISPHKRRAVFLVDLPQLLQAVDVGLIDAFDPPAAAVVAAGAEFTFRTAGIPQGFFLRMSITPH